MSKPTMSTMLIVLGAVLLAGAGTLRAQTGIDGGEPVHPPLAPGEAVLEVGYQAPYLLFALNDERVASVRLRIADRDGHPVYDSGETAGNEAGWDATPLESRGGAAPGLIWELCAWDKQGRLVQRQGGGIEPGGPGGEAPLLVTGYTVPGNYTIGGYLGVGTNTPERAVHIRGGNAVFRMDRSSNTAAFMIVRSDDQNSVLKTFVVGVNASGANNGSFVINDLGQATTGAGTTRLTIDNTGVATFGKEVKATGFVTTSSRQFKTNIRPLAGALDKVMRMQGVAFEWKDGGESSLGFIAEDVAGVAPEVVAAGADGQPAGIDYGRVSALLVESVKTQQAEIEQIKKDCAALEARLAQELQAVKNERPGKQD